MFLKSVSKRVRYSCFTDANRKISIIYLCIFILSSLFFSQTSLAGDKKSPNLKRQTQAYKFFKKNESDNIIELLSKNLTLLSFKELVILSEAYKWKKDFLNRAKVLKFALNIYPKKPSIKLELANSYLDEALSYATTPNFKRVREQNTDKARKLYNEVLKSNPSLPAYKAYINFLELTPNSPDEIIQISKEGKFNVGASPYFLNKLCVWNFNAGYISQGLKACREAIEVKKDDSESHLTLAKLLSDTGNTEDARDSFIKTANRFPASSNAQYFAAKILKDEGKIIESLKHLDLAIKNDPPDEALVLRANLLFNLNKTSEALEAYTLACKSHQEPRKPLLKEFKRNYLKIGKKDPIKAKYEAELYKCRYVYRPKRKKPKGFISAK